MSPDDAFVRQFVARFPKQLAPLLEEHLADNRGEILPYLFLADVMRRIVSSYVNADDAGDLGDVAAVLDYLEERFVAGDAAIEDLIALGFLENLPRKGEAGYGLRDLLGAALSDEASRVAGW